MSYPFKKIIWSTEDSGKIPSSFEWLHEDEKEKLANFRFEKRRDDWLLGRWTAKKVVRAFLNSELPLSDIEIRKTGSGAPAVYHANRLADTTVSISHSQGTSFCVAGASDIELGCDLELIESRSQVFVEDYFTENEKLQLEKAMSENHDSLINVIWSAKESALKAMKKGLRIDTRLIDVTYLQAPLASKPGWKNLMVYDRTHSRIFKGLWRIWDNYVMTIVSSEKDIIPNKV